MTTAQHAHIDPSHSALLVMDYQNGIVGMVENGEQLVAQAAELIASFRAHGGTVGYVRVAFADGELDAAPASSGMARNVTPERRATMHADSPNTQIADAIAPQDGDIVVRKQRVGAFSTTDLHEQLQARGIDTLLLAGISTSGCVHSTVLDGFDRDYRVIVLADACADPDPEVHRFLLERIFTKRGEVIETGDLHEQLRAAGVDTLILAGLSTSGVVLSTVRDGADRDYRVIVLADACADPQPGMHEFLTERVFPRQGRVITTAELAGLLG